MADDHGVNSTRESLGGVGSGELLCVRCLPKLTIAKIVYKGHSLCMGCAADIAAINKEAGRRIVEFTGKGFVPGEQSAPWDFLLNDPEALEKIKASSAPARATPEKAE